MVICFLGGSRYKQPLDATSAKKWRALAQLGEIHVIAFSPNLRPRVFTQQARFHLLPCLPLPILRYLTYFFTVPFLALWCIWRHGVNILVAQSPYEGAAGALAKTIARLLGRRVTLIVESHSDFEVSLFMQRDVFFTTAYRFLMYHAARFSLSQADVLRAVSHSTRKQLESWALDKSLLQFPAWTDIDLFLEAGEHRQSSGDIRPILYAGVLIPRKGVHFLLDAFAQVQREFPAAQLWIVGKAENPGYAASLRDQASQLGLDGRVTFMNNLPQSQLAGYMAQAEVFVLPSESEGLGRVVFEAMATGCPVIGSRVGGIPDMVEEGITGFLVPPGNITALIESLQWILENPEEAREMGQRAQKFAREFFSPEKYVRHYAQLFDMVSG